MDTAQNWRHVLTSFRFFRGLDFSQGGPVSSPTLISRYYCIHSVTTVLTTPSKGLGMLATAE